ncbi:3'(2'),5'-bisphosphate nucleotidase CysQ [Aquihabitans daechungensis]|uniref:3'(2'),5'-bisphosphate nucleotidase CysQ n=1 Tax=Aquihabitans daechungensis TaxID=1052257 RepID=UPI003B9F16BD
MTAAIPDPSDDHLLAAELAEGAGAVLLDVRSRLEAEGATAAELKAAGDSAAHEYLMERLAAARPHDAILSEEGSGATGRTGTERLDHPRVWIVDPLDGTREFSEPPRTDWAVHVALVSGGRPIAGSVALPAQGLVLNQVPAPALPPAPPSRPRVIVSRSRPPEVALHLAEAIGGELVELGSAGAKVAAVVLGQADVYPHSGGQYEWDSCAPVAVATAAGLVATRLDGSPLVYNNADPYLPDLLVCHPNLAVEVRRELDQWLASR